MRKTDVIAELIARGIPHDNNISADEAKNLLRNCINAEIKSAIEILAESHGHQVVFMPPDFSDLQPIELLRARIKVEVGRQYSKNTSLEDVRSRL